jgi:hypothetical protein
MYEHRLQSSFAALQTHMSSVRLLLVTISSMRLLLLRLVEASWSTCQWVSLLLMCDVCVINPFEFDARLALKRTENSLCGMMATKKRVCGFQFLSIFFFVFEISFETDSDDVMV